MKDIHTCKSCGFTSNHTRSFKIFKNVLVCGSCEKDYGVDENVTRWIDEANKVNSGDSLK